MKLCKDCASFRAPQETLNVGEYALCTSGLQLNPVTGETDLPTQSSRYCLNLRRSEKAGDCGSEAKLFTPKQLGVAAELSRIQSRRPS